MAHAHSYTEDVEDWWANGTHWFRKRCSCGADTVVAG